MNIINNPGFYNRRSIRLPSFDYSQLGSYFVTICAKNGECFFGDIDDGSIVLTNAGDIVRKMVDGLPERFPHINIDTYVIMPNHIHMIIAVGAQFIAPYTNRTPALGQIIRIFKAICTRCIRQNGHMDFSWQRNYYEHVIRNETDLSNIREYIVGNPLRWCSLFQQGRSDVITGMLASLRRVSKSM